MHDRQTEIPPVVAKRCIDGGSSSTVVSEFDICLQHVIIQTQYDSAEQLCNDVDATTDQL